MRAPFVSSRDSVSVRPLIVLRLEAADGAVGYGEAAPLEGYDGVTIDDVAGGARGLPRTARGVRRRSALGAAAPSARGPPSSRRPRPRSTWRCGTSTGRRLREPVWRLLGARDPAPVAVNATIAATRPGGRRARGRRRGGRGFWLPEGQGRRRRRRRTPGGGPGGGRAQMRIRLDANGAWSIPEAIAIAARARAGRDRTVRGTGQRRRGDRSARRADGGRARDRRERRRPRRARPPRV